MFVSVMAYVGCSLYSCFNPTRKLLPSTYSEIMNFSSGLFHMPIVELPFRVYAFPCSSWSCGIAFCVLCMVFQSWCALSYFMCF